MSSIADKLGTGSSFSHTRRERSARGRAKAITEGEIPSYELVRLHLDEVSPTPLNPRRNFGTDEEKTRFGEELRQAQLAACVVVTRGAYLKLWPDHEDRIGAALHILVNGERRYRSGVHVGLEALDFVVRDELASSREQFIKHLLEENLNREDFDVIERARGVEQLVSVCEEQSARGARARAAEQLGKDRSWVTNQLVLLTLPIEIQTMLSCGTMSERDGRALARHLKDNPELDAAALLDHLQKTKEAAAQAKTEEKEAVTAVRQGLLSTDNKLKVPPQARPSSADPEEAPDEGTRRDQANRNDSLSADNEHAEGGSEKDRGDEPQAMRPATSPGTADSPGDSEPASLQGRPLPYDDPGHVAMLLKLKMDPEVFATCTRMMMKALKEQQPEAFEVMVHELAE
ncbi:ParB/RepB/Spo0J family partition protein [Streptomyces sp. LaBMicrA B280]|uniref:ParB/RepB/Spo0J family partition protein n=1 Tax=Streptomyces sp. LaBMicrA B280 TaxID=3391001 RepID=UPI003BA6044B